MRSIRILTLIGFIYLFFTIEFNFIQWFKKWYNSLELH